MSLSYSVEQVRPGPKQELKSGDIVSVFTGFSMMCPLFPILCVVLLSMNFVTFRLFDPKSDLWFCTE